MTKEALIRELLKARIAEVRLKRLCGERGWYSNSIRQQEYQVILELSGEFPVKLICETMKVDCKCKLNKIYQATISVEYTLSRKASNSSSGL